MKLQAKQNFRMLSVPKKWGFRKKFCCDNYTNCWSFSIEILIIHSRHLPWNSKISKTMTIKVFFFLLVINISKEPQLLVLFYPPYWLIFYCVLPQWRQPVLVLQSLLHSEKAVVKSNAPNITPPVSGRKDYMHNPALFPEILNFPYFWTIAKSKFYIWNYFLLWLFIHFLQKKKNKKKIHLYERVTFTKIGSCAKSFNFNNRDRGNLLQM